MKDLLQAAVLLCVVPLLFYGGYSLLTRTAETVPEPLPPIFEGTKEKLTPLIEVLIPPPGPPPGDAWVAEIDRIKAKLTAIAPRLSADQFQELNLRLDRLRKHCVERRTQVPKQIGTESLLGQSLLRTAETIDRLGQKSEESALPWDWEAEFAVAEETRLDQRKASIEKQFDDQSRPLMAEHQNTLVRITRDNRQIEDDVQRKQDAIATIRRNNSERVDQQKRRTAFEKDKKEIERLLSPFITPAYWQLSTSARDWKKTAEAKPVSYRDLERLEALLPTIEGLREFATIGGFPQHVNPTTARPLGAFPAFYDTTLSDPAQLETIKRAQRLLKEHAPYLIESGLLLP